jgi:hypothetical protein
MQGFLIFHTLRACGAYKGVFVRVLRAASAKHAQKPRTGWRSQPACGEKKEFKSPGLEHRPLLYETVLNSQSFFLRKY